MGNSSHKYDLDRDAVSDDEVTYGDVDDFHSAPSSQSEIAIGAESIWSTDSVDNSCSNTVIVDEEGIHFHAGSTERNFSSLKPGHDIDHREYIYPFENLVFEGGGNKGLAYCGAVKEMEEMGLMKQIRRFGGASAGAMTATLIAVGYSSDEIKQFLVRDLKHELYDHRCGYLSLLPNLLRNYGWNPGKSMLHWFEDRLLETTNMRSATFRDVYEKFGNELCVVVTNISEIKSTYCHVKTTPDLPVALAVRMSLGIPGVFAATKVTMNGHTDVFVDGGLLCNYPIHCFDGWWLSMDPRDSFVHRLQPISKIVELKHDRNRFAGGNEKTVGFLLYSDDEAEIFRNELDNRPGADLPEYPNTKLARKHKRHKEGRLLGGAEGFSTALDKFFQVLDEKNIDDNDISIKDLASVFKSPTFNGKQQQALFGKTLTAVEAFELIKKARHLKKQAFRRKSQKQRHTLQSAMHQLMYENLQEEHVNFEDVLSYLETKSGSAVEYLHEFNRREIKDVGSFLDSIMACLELNLKREYMQVEDVERTVGVNTGYLGTLNIDLEEKDVDFLVELGRRSFISFLKFFVNKNQPPRKDDEVTMLY